MNAQNILDVYATATADERRDGAHWYSAAHTFCLGLSKRYDVPVETAAAVVAVLSPRLTWALNLRYADQYLRTGDAPTFFSTKAKLARIVAGEPLDDVLDGGPKVRSFYANILSPATSIAVTIDRHAYDIVAGTTDDKGRKGLEAKGVYESCAEAYRTAAETLGVAPHVVQAVTWLAWKRAKEYTTANHTTLYSGARGAAEATAHIAA